MAAEIVRVISNNPDAAGLQKARDLRIPALAIPNRIEPSREAHEARVLAALADAQVDWICLAGYMRKLSTSFVAQHSQRVLNVHPSLLPAFPGMEAQRQAIEWGVKVAGCTVHLVDETLDQGPIVVQRTVPVRGDDTVESLSARILAEEHKAYPEALQRLITEPWEVVGRRVLFRGSAIASIDG